ncbi:MAG: ATP-binding cassette domain-containing protein [Candidatus Schekmanbacteria bacterium]|nr:ATP-binding cassette domain-containing protein [Candidatus Schekmanbacteria bacterium]
MIDLSQVYFSYPTAQGNLPALKNINLHIEPGEFIALLGANSSGKSTLCKLMAGLLLPQSGEISFNTSSPNAFIGDIKTGFPITSFGNDKMGSSCIKLTHPLIGLILANPEDQILCPAVEEEIAFGLQNLGLPYPVIMERVEKSLELLQLASLRKKPTYSLSGGEQQKLIIAALLALQPRCLILDEAVSFLDAQQKKLIQEVVRNLNKEQGVSIIWSTPLPEETEAADRVFVLHNGELTPQGSNAIKLRNCHCETVLSPKQSHPLDTRDCFAPLAMTNYVKRSDYNPAPKTKIPPSANADTKALLSIQNLTYKPAYHSDNILTDLNLNIRQGEFWGITGQIGSGKTTLLQLLCGILIPTSGKVHRSDAIRPDAVGMVFQYPERQFFNTDIMTEAAFGLRQKGLKEAEIGKRTEQVFSLLKLDGQLHHKSWMELSGGEKRRLAIACILVMQPQVLLLDEPTAGLDTGNKRDLIAVLKHLHHQSGLTIVMVSHDIFELTQLTENILILPV